MAKPIPEALMRAESPDLIVLHSTHPPHVAPDGALVSLPGGHPVERRVARMPWVRANYRVVLRMRYATTYYYTVLGRTGP